MDTNRAITSEFWYFFVNEDWFFLKLKVSLVRARKSLGLDLEIRFSFFLIRFSCTYRIPSSVRALINGSSCDGFREVISTSSMTTFIIVMTFMSFCLLLVKINEYFGMWQTRKILSEGWCKLPLPVFDFFIVGGVVVVFASGLAF